MSDFRHVGIAELSSSPPVQESVPVGTDSPRSKIEGVPHYYYISVADLSAVLIQNKETASILKIATNHVGV